MKVRLLLWISLGTVSAALAIPAGALAVPPTIDRQWVSGVTSSDATLYAEINPNGLQTHYELQIDTTGSFKFAQTSSCPLSLAPMWCLAVMVPGDPLPPGLVQPPEFILPAGTTSQQVSVNMASIGATLQPGTTYHYRAIAANGEVLVEGPEQTFTTSSAIEPDPDDQSETVPTGGGDASSSFRASGSAALPMQAAPAGQIANGNPRPVLRRCKRKPRRQSSRRPGWARQLASRKRCIKLATARPPAR